MFSKKKKNIETDVPDIKEKYFQIEEKYAFLKDSVRTLLVLIKNFSLDIKELKTDEFKNQIDSLSDTFSSEEKIQKIKAFFEKQKQGIQSFIEKQKKYLGIREKEIADIIKIFTNAMVDLNDDNRNFNKKIYSQSERIDQLATLDDLKKIKSSLKQETLQMREVIKEKQDRDNRQIAQLSSKVESLSVELEKVKEESMLDKLTGVYNREAFDSYVQNLIDRNRIKPEAFSLLVIDIDAFKAINDNYGHQVGDGVILAMVNKCKEFIRNDDLFARFGGDEFVIVLKGASLRAAAKRAKLITKSISSARYSLNSDPGTQKISFTISIGISAYRDNDTVETFFNRADIALYAAKKSGKNTFATENG